MRTGQSPYDLARLLEDYPEVFDAYYWVAMAVGPSNGTKETMGSRRERTRDDRIRRAGRR